jgi:hypothetical protein
VHFVPSETPAAATPRQAFAHHFDCMIHGLLPFRGYDRGTIGGEDSNGVSMLQNDDLFAPLDLGEQLGKRLIGLTGADGLHDPQRMYYMYYILSAGEMLGQDEMSTNRRRLVHHS